MNLNTSILRRPKLPIVLAYLNSVIDNNTLWSPPKVRESKVAITSVSTGNTGDGVSVSFDPEAGDVLPKPKVEVVMEEPMPEPETEEVEVNNEVDKPEEPVEPEDSGFVIKEI
jgi:hypothetical protein